MKLKAKIAKIILFLLSAIIYSSSLSAYAAEAINYAKTGSLKITEISSNTEQPVASIKLSVYKIASLNSNTTVPYTLTEGFQNCGININELITSAQNESASLLIQSYIKANNVKETAIATTDINGTGIFSNLELGLYLVDASYSKANSNISSKPFIVAIPILDANTKKWIYDVTAEPKIIVTTNNDNPVSTRPSDVYISRSVVKVWNDKDNSAKTRPSFVDVRLYRDNILYDTVTLNDTNKWTYIWDKLSTTNSWTLKETNVPTGYTSVVTNTGTTFTITNTYSSENPPKEEENHNGNATDTNSSGNQAQEEVDHNGNAIDTNSSGNESQEEWGGTDTSGNLPQTGQQVSMIYILGAIGIIFVILGLFQITLEKRKKKRE